jgi:hypothetical protein
MGSSKKVPAGMGDTIDADGADPGTCRLLEAKYASSPDRPAWRPDGFFRMLDQADDEFMRYYGAVQTNPLVNGLEVRTNSSIARAYFEDRLQTYGFTIGVNGFSFLFVI